MNQYTLTVGKLTALTVEITIDRDAVSARATGQAVDINANVVTELPESTFVGFCDADIVSSVVWSMLFGTRINGTFYDAPDLKAAIERFALSCTCPD